MVSRHEPAPDARVRLATPGGAGALFVAADEDAPARVWGGAFGSDAFPREGACLDDAVGAHRVWRLPRGAAFAARSLRDVAGGRARRRGGVGALDDARWRAHLHLNVTPAARGAGAGCALVDENVRLADEGTPSRHARPLVESPRAVRFPAEHGGRQRGSPVRTLRVCPGGRRARRLTMVHAIGGATSG